MLCFDNLRQTSPLDSIIGSESNVTTKELLDLLVHLRIIAPFKDGKFFIPCVINHLPEASDEDWAPEGSIVAPLVLLRL